MLGTIRSNKTRMTTSWPKKWSPKGITFPGEGPNAPTTVDESPLSAISESPRVTHTSPWRTYHEKTTRRDLAIILGAILLALLSLTLLGNLTIDSSTDAFMPTSAPVIAVNREIERQFGSMDALVLGVSVPDGSILNTNSLELIDLLTQRIVQLDSIDTVTSITNTDHMQAGTQGFEAVPLYAGTSPRQLDELMSRLAEWPEIYDGNLISADRSMAAIIIQTTAGTGQDELGDLLDQLGDLVDSVEHDQESFSIIGLPVVKQQINRSLMSDMSILVPIVGLLIILVLFFSFRRVAESSFPWLDWYCRPR